MVRLKAIGFHGVCGLLGVMDDSWRFCGGGDRLLRSALVTKETGTSATLWRTGSIEELDLRRDMEARFSVANHGQPDLRKAVATAVGSVGDRLLTLLQSASSAPRRRLDVSATSMGDAIIRSVSILAGVVERWCVGVTVEVDDEAIGPEVNTALRNDCYRCLSR
jgi:hypothetical protein